MPKKLTTSIFIEKSNKVHNNFYDYSLSEFINSRTNTIIICPIHGQFKQKPSNHTFGKGCFECGKIKTSNNNSSNTNDFIDKSNKVHKNKYTYKNCVYKRWNIDSIITCPIHGDFTKTPNEHYGPQHSKPIEWYGGKESFEKQKLRDNIKTNWCLEKNIKLIRISYKDPKKINNILKDIFSEYYDKFKTK